MYVCVSTQWTALLTRSVCQIHTLPSHWLQKYPFTLRASYIIIIYTVKKKKVVKIFSLSFESFIHMWYNFPTTE